MSDNVIDLASKRNLEEEIAEDLVLEYEEQDFYVVHTSLENMTQDTEVNGFFYRVLESCFYDHENWVRDISAPCIRHVVIEGINLDNAVMLAKALINRGKQAVITDDIWENIIYGVDIPIHYDADHSH